jgi:hypothetical protein
MKDLIFAAVKIGWKAARPGLMLAAKAFGVAFLGAVGASNLGPLLMAIGLN